MLIPERIDRIFLNRQEYRYHMHYPFVEGYVEDREADLKTLSFQYRHYGPGKAMGVWRWRGMFEHKARLLSLLGAEAGDVIDFGGASGPLGLGTQVVDVQDTDRTGAIVLWENIDEVPGRVRGIFSSHTLEHIKDLQATLRAMYQRVEEGGWIVLHLPSWTCTRWRAAEKPGKEARPEQFGSPHWWTFGVTVKPPIEGLHRYVGMDKIIPLTMPGAKYTAEECGDNSIWVEVHKL